jgi:filamentous hemagglutinin family protein
LTIAKNGRSPWQLLKLLFIFSVLDFLDSNSLQAQILPDNTLDPSESSQIERVNAQRDRITGGATRGSNLFHSFREFNIDEGRAAYFANPAAIKTIFSRVTGNNPSQIFGTLGVEGNANLFFINPNGIIFGSNATLDVRGSFIASTANSIAFPNGETFNATNPNAPPLLTIDVPVPIGLRFESDNSGIILNGANLETRQNLALIGAGIGSSGRIVAPGGDLTLATVPGAVDSIVGLDGTGKFLGTIQGNGQPNLENRDILILGGGIGAFSNEKAGNVVLNSAGNVGLSNGALVDVRGGGGGSISVNAQNLEMSSGAQLLAGIGNGLGSLGAKAGNIEINAVESVKVRGNSQTTIGISNTVGSQSIGDAGDVIINTGTLEGSGSFGIASATAGRGNAGKVAITATDEVSLRNLQGSASGIGSLVFPSAIGNGGDVGIKTRSLFMTNRGFISTTTFGEGDGGTLTVNASESVRLIGVGGLATGTLGKGKAGNLTINTGQLLVRDGAAIATTAEQGSQGNGGTLTVNVTESIQLVGTSANGQSRSRLTSSTLGKGNAGDLFITTRQLLVQNGAVVAAASSNEGNGGNLTIATGQLLVKDGSLISTTAFGQGDGGNLAIDTDRLLIQDSGIISTNTFGEGNGGNLDIKAETLSLTNGALMLANTSDKGDAGDITIDAGNVTISGSNRQTTDSSNLIFASIITTQVESGAEGNGGKIDIEAESLSMNNAGNLATGTLGRGDAGDISIAVDDFITMNNVSVMTSNVAQGGVGKAGNIDIRGRSLTLSNGSEIQSGLFRAGNGVPGGIGQGGEININASDFVEISGVSSSVPVANPLNPSITIPANGFSSGIFTSTQRGASGPAGNITVTTGAFRLADGAVVEAQTANEGIGGNITINANTFEAIGGGQVITAARQRGDAGNITLNVLDSMTLSGSDPNFTERLARFGDDIVTNQGAGSGLFANTTEGSTGKGGNIFVYPQTLTIADGATISVNSQGQEAGGVIELEADSLTLDNGTISAETASTQGGDITLNVQDLLLLRNGAQISTTAGTAEAGGDGGRIFLDAGSIVAVPDENSDITANAFTGDGGRVVINTQSIFGIDFRQQLTPLSDITASSQTGTPGEVIINTSGIEPTRGLENLTEERINVEVAQGCQVGGTARGRISFYNVGRGGLPPSPDDLLNSVPTQEWLSLESQENRSSQPKNEPIFLQQPNNKVASGLIFSCQGS